MLPVKKLRVEPIVKKTIRSCRLLGVQSLKDRKPKDAPSLDKAGAVSYSTYSALSVCHPRNKKHRVTVVVYTTEKGAKRVWVRCDCEYFMYKCEWVLSKFGSTTRRFAINKAPTATNPRGIPYVCKHVLLLLSVLQKSKRVIK